MVDLDGARDGKRKNSAIVQAVAEVGLRIELGGGIRSMADLDAVFGLGVWVFLPAGGADQTVLGVDAIREGGPQ